ncbi:MAG: HAMP domain-containing protein, partial [Anaerolineales bacterium]|nr:HAMP domain-containing protein [Anaerolineales bacterium]
MKLNIRNKLLGSFLFIIVIMMGLGVFALMQLDQTNDRTLLIGQNTVPSIRAMDEIELMINQYRRYQLRHVIATTAAEMEEQEAGMTGAEVELNQLFKAYEPLVSDDQDRALLEEVKSHWQAYQTASSAFLAPSRELNTEAAAQALKGDAEKTLNDLATAVQNWQEYNVQLANQSLDASEAAYAISQNWIIGIVVGAALAGLGIAFYLARSLSNAAKQMVQTAEQIAQTDLPTLAGLTAAIAGGDLTQTATIQTRSLSYQASDEMGDLARAFNQMIARLQETGRSF